MNEYNTIIDNVIPGGQYNEICIEKNTIYSCTLFYVDNDSVTIECSTTERTFHTSIPIGIIRAAIEKIENNRS